ncbi:hypothetical protein EKH55_3065 [Sinorhizobium alkalisoli]|nr:hypothetical protein EKH55_3065 [Sinorhizobium alkalisoli]
MGFARDGLKRRAGGPGPAPVLERETENRLRFSGAFPLYLLVSVDA